MSFETSSVHSTARWRLYTAWFCPLCGPAASRPPSRTSPHSPEPAGAHGGQAIREAIYYELSEHRDRYTTTIQDIAQSDLLIHRAGLTDSAAAALPAPELCRILGVDAVMRGSVTKFKKHGAAGQIVTAALFGFAKGSDVKADVAIYDGGDGQLIYQHNIEKAGGLFSSPDALRNDVGKTVAKNFPYKKKG